MITTEQRRTIEARLDRLDARTARATSRSDYQGVLRGILDLLRDVLLAEEPKPAPMTAEMAEALSKRAT